LGRHHPVIQHGGCGAQYFRKAPQPPLMIRSPRCKFINLNVAQWVLISLSILD